MADYLEKRRQLYYAVLTVPDALREELGLRFIQSTGTGDRRQAKIIAASLVAGWKLLIEKAKGKDTGYLADAIQFREDIKNAQDAEYREALESVLIEHAERLEQTHGLPAAKQFVDVSLGIQTPHSLYFENWKQQLTISPRTVLQYTKDLQLFIEQFPVIEDVDKKGMSLWLDELAAKGVSKISQRRIIKACRNYWKYLSRYNIKGMVEDPFHNVILTDKGKKKVPRETFEPHEIVELWSMAKDRHDDVLADLIALGAYTGARIEELCSLMVKDVSEDVLNITDSKTSAGVRAVPVHSHIKPVVKRLIDGAKDGYLLPNLSLDKFGKRSNTMSSKFGKLKTKAGHGRLKVFHSLRHTLVTALVNAGVMEFHIADIVGHEKKGVTGNVYAKAIGIDVKRVAIEKVSYPLTELT